LGAAADVEFPQAKNTLDPNDWLIAYTDGISEQIANGQTFGLEKAIVSALRSGPGARPLLRRLFDEFIGFLGPIPVEDDIALVAAHVLPAAARNRKRKAF
jgi:sigma-B regulation protein RsbU (phosphoserine phosphatase)